MKEIFKAKDGDIIGFLASGLAQYPIQIATRQPCTHCGMVFNVKKEKNKISFNFSEQTFFGGKFDLVVIEKKGNKYISNYARLNNSKKIYFKPLSKPLTEEQKRIGIEDALGQVGKKYGYLSLIFGLWFFEKILPQRIEDKINVWSKTARRVCSTHCAIILYKMGLIEFNQETFYSPYDIIDLDI